MVLWHHLLTMLSWRPPDTITSWDTTLTHFPCRSVSLNMAIHAPQINSRSMQHIPAPSNWLHVYSFASKRQSFTALVLNSRKYLLFVSLCCENGIQCKYKSKELSAQEVFQPYSSLVCQRRYASILINTAVYTGYVTVCVSLVLYKSWQTHKSVLKCFA